MAKWNIGKHLSVLTKEKIIIGRKNLFAWVKDKKRISPSVSSDLHKWHRPSKTLFG